METTFDGFYPTHPGEVLKDELEERGISQKKICRKYRYGIFRTQRNTEWQTSHYHNFCSNV